MKQGENMPQDQAMAAANQGALARPFQDSDYQPGPEKGSLPPTLGMAADMGLNPAPGFNYFHHLLVRDQLSKGNGEEDDSKAKKPGVYTDQEDAAKTAIQMLGIYSDKNPVGLPIPLHSAKELFFKDRDPTGSDMAEWRNSVDRGDRGLDPKHIRKFVNHDGSLTYEVLNHDKTVQARFTMGSVGDKVIFATGGYSAFKDTLDKFHQEFGTGSNDSFDSIRAGLNNGGQ